MKQARKALQMLVFLSAVIEIRVRNLQDQIHENSIFSLDCITKFTKIYMTEVIFTGHGLSVLC